MHPVITIDGQSGSGKGTLAYRLAQYFAFGLLDSGALYRLVGLVAYQQGLFDEAMLADSPRAQVDERLTALARNLPMSFMLNDGSPEMTLLWEGHPVNDDIRSETVGLYASFVAQSLGVRTALLTRQQNSAQHMGIVADGRDMGTVVFPQATAKLFLTASPEVRARRRQLQLQQAGKSADFDAILAQIIQRDAQDQQRLHAPSRPALDAKILDTSALSADAVYQTALTFALSKPILHALKVSA